MTELLSRDLAPDIHLLPANATLPEKALAALGPMINELDDPVSRIWDPWACPAAALPFLAWAARTPLWDEAWAETKKRAVIAESPDLNAVKGTVYAIARYVEIMGGEAVRFQLPPSGIYVSAGPDEAATGGWRERFAEIRIYDRPGGDTIAWDFCGEAFAGLDGGEPDGVYLAPYAPRPKRRAELHDGGVVTQLELVESRVHGEGGETRIAETLFGPGFAPGGFFPGDGLGSEAFAGLYLDPAAPVLFLTMVNGAPAGRAGVDAVLVSDRAERVVVTGEQDDFLIGDGAAGVDYLQPSQADRMIFESLRLYDPARSQGQGEAGFCLDDADLFSLPPNHILVDVDARFTLARQAAFTGGFDGDFMLPDDGAWRAGLYRAAAAANPTSDRTLASSTLHRPVRFSDGFAFGAFSFGQMVNTHQINAQ